MKKKDDSVPIIAPVGFLEHAVSENIFAGNAMTRRATFMYGIDLPKAPDGQIGFGLGLDTSTGTFSLVPPTLDITHTGQEETIDGVRIVFQLTPGTEAPSEMNFYFPERQALCMAENAVHNLHNIVTLRGAVVRDAHVWSRYLGEAISLYAHGSDVLFASHHWPTWGKQEIVKLLSEQRDLYAYLHDQTLRLMNAGLTGPEIAEELVLPPNLQRAWHTQGYYGSVSHNVKAIYQRYMGWYDGNPVHLWEHPPRENASRYVECMGGLEATVSKAEGFAKKGDLRFAATMLGHAVFAEPADSKAREALAKVLIQLGQGAECGTWRNCYLTGAMELREGVKQQKVDLGGSMSGLTIDQLLASLAMRVDGPAATKQDLAFIIDLKIKDEKRQWRLILSNGALTSNSEALSPEYSGHGHAEDAAGLTLTLTKQELLQLLGTKTIPEGVKKEGSPELMVELLNLLVVPNPTFAIVTP